MVHLLIIYNRQRFGNFSRIQLTYNNESEQQQKILGSILRVTLETSYLKRICHLSCLIINISASFKKETWVYFPKAYYGLKSIQNVKEGLSIKCKT